MRQFGLALILCTAAAVPALAQQAPGTLADIRQDLSVLYVEIQRLKQELNTTGSTGVQVGGSSYDRLVAIEAELARITSKTEQLEFRINQVVQDGTNRVGDLEFRLCELEPNCDIGALGDTPQLGGVAPQTAANPALAPAPAPAPAAQAPLPTGGAQLAVSEEADFRRAQEALANGDFRGAVDLFAAFRETYPLGPLESAALLGEGKALAGLGDTREAARRYLRAYADFPDSEPAPEALWRLGDALAALGSTAEACVTLQEVARRYPQATQFVTESQASLGRLTCP
ncbi:tetratricopeptide repeat protein [Thalassococcus sp. CAU 1522]|uniref:Cell division coordinator CpoB n=1 Tax=Thalassococcus arenae TaxID=2851652 RepID=A0ABS6N472_9RHOB|nr:tetratricopeptide repeat protein [Thalassococcus arenae]MBV2358825.1 tetratricopeptide repeat protein [Thalassococcus arenae]